MTTDPRPHSESELVELVRSIDVRAPERVHRRVQALVAEREGADAGRGGRRWALRPAPAIAAGAAALAAVAVAIVLAAGSGGSGALSVQSASALTLSAPTGPAPRESASNRSRLTAAVDGISFPYWAGRLGWRTSGTRSDRLQGRAVTTVFYSDRQGRRVGYTIVSGTYTSQLSGGAVVRREGTPYRLLTQHGAAVVTWLRAGHLCVVSGRGVDSATLLRLASWNDRATAS